MDINDNEFLKRIKAAFLIEAKEHLKSFSLGLIELEKTQTEENYARIIETMFREVHSLKGAARSVSNSDIASVCHPLESLFSLLKGKEINLDKALLDLFYKTCDFLSGLVSSEGLEQLPVAKQNMRSLIQQLQQFVPPIVDVYKDNDTKIKATEIRSEEHQPVDVSEIKLTADYNPSILKINTEIVRIPISKLDPLLLQAEEFLQSNISFIEEKNELTEILNQIIDWRSELLKRHKVSVISSDLQWNEYKDENALRLSNLENRLSALTQSMERNRYGFEQLVNNHLEATKQVLMLPISSLVEVFPAMVREIARDQQKEIDFIINGAELEIDKRILDDLKDPLIHIIRNSIDHGIGTPKERILQNKPSRGTIVLSFIPKDSGIVEITVSDDGKGINKEKVLISALKSGALSNADAEKMNNDEILSLIYQSGISTSNIITDLSGRGLGLSIVRESVEKLNGTIFIDTIDKRGTTFRILLPMTLSTFRGILISQGDFQFFLPTMNVDRVLRLKAEEIKTVENHETITIDEEILSLVSLAEVLELKERNIERKRRPSENSEDSNYVRIIVLVSRDRRIAIKVDEVLGEHQILVKGFGNLLKHVRNISGSTILGSGKIIPVLHVSELIKSAINSAGQSMKNVDEEMPIVEPWKILVAEDSITSRMLLKNILETAGYQVTVAVDGVEAYTRAKSGEFDLIVSDVDMPMMNGFELTIKVKNDAKINNIPVVLVTSLESRDDRERGIEVGADAYIIKSSFDQGNLLDVIKKLI